MGSSLSRFTSDALESASLFLFNNGLLLEAPVEDETQAPQPLARTEADELVALCQRWADSYGDSPHRGTVAGMGFRLLELHSLKSRLGGGITSFNEILDILRSEIKCSTCGNFASHPFFLPCLHLHCGPCLEKAFQNDLERRMKTSPLRSSEGILLPTLMQTLPQDKEGLLAALRMAGLESRFMTYTTPCCRQLMDQPPSRILSLSQLCKTLRGDGINGTDEDPDAAYFSGWFV
ncbi:hypothetical protein BDN72DRAFT_900684 [Pluteus cervinus]|uniref:Uncharacterized protein n=1 Tax=Pluteus cervinus TaxID=181527 RepID=A0ACD3AI75_9AGAR|nr:hypothetical protein BDN72DRAFT_900684 [Pluteus cervinus]